MAKNIDNGTKGLPSAELRDLLPTPAKGNDFVKEVGALQLSAEFTRKIVAEYQAQQSLDTMQSHTTLERNEESELATEALILRHRFTEQVCSAGSFRQAAISIISNIYLFANRRIFFQAGESTEKERQHALLLLTSPKPHIPIAKSFQHHIVALIWSKICATPGSCTDDEIEALTETIIKLNTIRNIYITHSLRFIHKMAGSAPPLYMQGISREDATQIASFGVARAAYRYHPSLGVRFTTFSARWVQKEIQRQALQGRLIRLSPYSIQQNGENCALSPPLSLEENRLAEKEKSGRGAESIYEQKEMQQLIEHFLQTELSEKSADIIRRRYGLPPYAGKNQSVIAIASHYKVSRSSIYQQEQSSITKLRRHFAHLQQKQTGKEQQKDSL